ncbi:hypothetical protein ACILE9_02885 [Capnocytophaga cynodegmi]|uniref:hypothetical protein n=1 Tax=Capnocytophaga cynodegmi TaxID=28189 RepID=UPI0037D6DD71
MKIEKGKFYKSLVGNEYIRVDGFDEDGDPLGVIFESFETYLTFSSNTYIETAFYMGDYQEITEKEFYTALDLARGQFIKDFKAVRGGVL